MTDLSGGRLFVVHGRIEALVHDAAIIPVGDTFHFSRYWGELVGTARPTRPDRWSREGWGRVVNAADRIWAVSITSNDSGNHYDEILRRIGNCLTSIDKRRTKYDPKRGEGTRPLVAIPVIGIGRGGFGRTRGDVLRDLIEHLTSEAATKDLDIALVTPDPSVYAAAQYARRRLPTVLPDGLESTAQKLGRQAREGELALFLGAGVGVPAQLPSWTKLVEELAQEFKVADLGASKDGLTITDQAELIEKSSRGEFQKRVADKVKPFTQASLLHGLLAGLDCREAVTTNYDVLYESAVRATGRSIDSVLPWASAHGAERWILKMHGDQDHPETIVLTRRHMVRYDAANRPSGSMLQSLLLTKHLLVVGASMSDDNVIRLAHEVQNYRTDHQGKTTAPFGTVLDVDGNRVRAALWEGQLDWVSLPEAGIGHGTRVVELMLDRIAFHAARDSSWLLDERFIGLLEGEDNRDRTLADAARQLYELLPHDDETKWRPLARRLQEMGVDAAGRDRDTRARGRR